MAIHEAQRRLVEEYSERGYQFAFGLCGNSEDAKELVQEAFYRILRKWDSYDAGQPLEGWFLGILRNLYMDSLKRYERRHGVSLDAPLAGRSGGDLNLADAMADPNEEALLDRLCRRNLGARVRRALDGLSREHKAVLTLLDIEGLTYGQIGQVMDCPLNTVRSRVNRARAALKKVILEKGKEAYADGL
ncbi:MAG: RNA polymerase sigma factor [Elusimicrobia bacterium]|nr:RNA polymerase sigma factor [Elusimicrobiota bacterium]